MKPVNQKAWFLILPVRWNGLDIEVAGHSISNPAAALKFAGAATLGVRPEYVVLAAPNAAGAVPAVVTQAQDIGTYWLLSARVGGGSSGTAESVIRVRLNPEQVIPQIGDTVWLCIVGVHTCFYKNDQLIEEASA